MSTENSSLKDTHGRVTSKKVDYVLALDLPENDPLKERATLLAGSPAPADKSLAYLTQMRYRPLFGNTIAVFLRRKRQSSTHTNSLALSGSD